MTEFDLTDDGQTDGYFDKDAVEKIGETIGEELFGCDGEFTIYCLYDLVDDIETVLDEHVVPQDRRYDHVHVGVTRAMESYSTEVASALYPKQDDE